MDEKPMVGPPPSTRCFDIFHQRELESLRAEVQRLKQLVVDLAEARPTVRWGEQIEPVGFPRAVEYEVRLTFPEGRQLVGRAMIGAEMWHSAHGGEILDVVAADVHREMNGKSRELHV